MVRRLVALGLALLTATVGLTAAAPAFADETTGTVTGHITDAGLPYSAGFVALMDQYQSQIGGGIVPDADGVFTFTDVPPGDYRLVLQHDMGLQQWYHQKFDFQSADTFTVVAGQETVVDEQVFPHGSVSGTITDSDGNPLYGATVSLFASPTEFVTQWGTDENGHYVLPIVLPGTYYVLIGTPVENSPDQWRGQKRFMEESEPITVGVGENVTVDEARLPTATIHGRVTRSGVAVRNTAVIAVDAATDREMAFASTDRQGNYTLHPFLGAVKVSFKVNPDGPVTIWARGKGTPETADVFNLVAGDDIAVDQDLTQPGTITGHLSQSDGSPAPGAQVEVINASTGVIKETTTDDSGSFSLPVNPANYQVLFVFGNRQQFAYGTSGDGDDPPPTVFTVGASQVVTVDDTLRYATSATLTVTAVDAITKSPITTFCASESINGLSAQACTEDGTVKFRYLAPGNYNVATYVDGETDYLGTLTENVQVAAGDNALAVKLNKPATLQITAKDSKTGAPVTNACVNLALPDQPSTFAAGSICTDDAGRLTLSGITPDTYNAFMWANDGVHGHQWVGPNGGTGAMANAKPLKFKSGSTLNLTVKMDLAGSITGVITDAASGQPLTAYVSTSTRFADQSGVGGSDGTGRYTINNLGPYDWTLFFRSADHASQWSGGTGDRFAAETVRVKSGKTSTYNMRMKTGTVLTGTVQFSDGNPVGTGNDIIVVSKQSRDDLGEAVIINGTYQTWVLGPLNVKLRYFFPYAGPIGANWYLTSFDFAGATTVSIPAHGTKTLNITVPLIN
jgi:protocatechuate 3,4-dioxygenase beta subunit